MRVWTVQICSLRTCHMIRESDIRPPVQRTDFLEMDLVVVWHQLKPLAGDIEDAYYDYN